MVKGHAFYGVWDEEKGLWCRNEDDVRRLVDKEIEKTTEEVKKTMEGTVVPLYLRDFATRKWTEWQTFCKSLPDNYVDLDSKVVFENSIVKKKDYVSRRLPYSIKDGPIPAYDKLISILYEPEERQKIEWSIGAIVSGESIDIQKFVVFYGAMGTGKSTILNIIQQLFDGYYALFDAKALGSSNNSFALEAFRNNPLVAIQHDGDLSKIEDNTKLNSIVSHEEMIVNEKFKTSYSSRFRCFLFMGTNKPVRITDAKSGIIRRLIDIIPSGNKIEFDEYNRLKDAVRFELGAIAWHCLQVYKELGAGFYNKYKPNLMLGETNDFYNFVEDRYDIFCKEDGTSLKSAWAAYKEYNEEANVPYPYPKRLFKYELKAYFKKFEQQTRLNGAKVLNYYSGFLREKIRPQEDSSEKTPNATEPNDKLSQMIDELGLVSSGESVFDLDCHDYPAQYATEDGSRPLYKWSNCKTKLQDIRTDELHFVKVPINHIVIDFDIKDSDGNKDLLANLVEASKWPKTYTELSKSGSGVHLHYIYTGDPTKLSSIYDENIEVKVFVGNSSLRRKLTLHNSLPIQEISSGLPLKERSVNKVVDWEGLKNEKALRTLIKRALQKEYGSTKVCIDLVYDNLERAYSNPDFCYDITDMRPALFSFAANSTHNAKYCIDKIGEMKWTSKETSENVPDSSEEPLVFFDIEIFQNLFLICWKKDGSPEKHRMFNPTSSEVSAIVERSKLVGFNNRDYDNHILYAAMLGYSVDELYRLSTRIIGNSPNAKFREAYNLSYTDVYDFASAGNKKSLKKWEIELGLKHNELGLPWDEPVDPSLWDKVGEYCCDDVDATEKVFHHLVADYNARLVLAVLANGTPNDTTNQLTTKIIFGHNRKPQTEFVYRDLSKPVFDIDPEVEEFLKEACPEMMSQRHGEANSVLPYFPEYKFDKEHRVSTFKDRVLGEGGNVYAYPGVYFNVALLDISSQHPHTIISECLFGPRYTKAFRDIVRGRVSIKHKDWETVDKMLDGKLAPFTKMVKDGIMSAKDLANALKTAINSVYGLTAAGFENAFRDNRNIDNIVAKRGALFMETLRYEVQKRGFVVAHIKTDSIKIPNATKEIIDFVMSFGKKYGYSFEHEATYDRMCLVNDAVYIAKYASKELCEELYGYCPDNNESEGGKWTATGTQFKVPYVFKTLFSKEELTFEDYCETKSVKSALYLDMNEGLPDVSQYEKELAVLDYNSGMESIGSEKRKKPKMPDLSREDLVSLINSGHRYHFVGKCGSFTPIKDGYNAGLLVTKNNNKYASASNSKGYRWLESAIAKDMPEDSIDMSYWTNKANEAIDAIEKYVLFEDFLDDSYKPN